MATIKLITREGESLELGKRFKVFLRVLHNSKCCYVPTGVTVGTSLQRGKVVLNFMHGIVLPAEPGSALLNQDLALLLQKAQRTINNLRNPSTMTCKEVVAALQYEDVYCIDHKLSAVAEDYARKLDKAERYEYATMLRVSMADWMSCFGDIRVEKITPSMVETWKKYLMKLTKNGKVISEATAYKKLSHLKVVINHAIARGIPIEPHPFTGVRIPRSDADYSVVDNEVYKHWAAADIPEGTAQIVHDMWMLTFYLCGANFCDIYGADLSGPVFTYSRQKIRTKLQKRLTTHIPIIPEARRIINKYIGKDGRLHFHFQQKDSKSIIRYMGHYLRKMRQPFGLPADFKFSTARDTFAQYCMELMYPDAITDYLLGHSANSRGVMSYYSKVPPKIAEKYILRVVDYAENPERYEDYIEQRMFGM